MFRCSGPFALSEVRRAFDQMISDPGFDPGINALWDLRTASIGAHDQEIPDILGTIHSRQKQRSGGHRVAILVAAESTAGLPSTRDTNADSRRVEVRVFHNYALAARWLGGDDV